MKYGALACGLRPVWAAMWLSLSLLWASHVSCYSETSVSVQSNVSDEQVIRIVDNIDLIVGLPAKKGEPQWDAHATAIVKLGARAAPHLVKKITDTSPTKVHELFPYKVGDVALALLHDIYEPHGWPFPDNSVRIPQKYGDFRDYVDFVDSDEIRKLLQESWQRYIKSHGPGASGEDRRESFHGP